MELLLAVFLSAVAAGPTDAEYPDSILATIPVGGDPTDIAVTPAGDRAYVGNELADYVTVIDIPARAVLTRLDCGNMTNMVAAHPDSPYVYVTCGNDDRVAVIRTTDNSVVTTIPVGDSPHRLQVSDDGTRCYVACQNSNSVSVIDTRSNTTIASVPVGDTPRDVCCLPAGDTAYAANIREPAVSVIRTSDNANVGSINTGFATHRIRALPDGRHVYASEYHGDRVAVIRTADRTLVTTVSPGTWVCGLYPVCNGDYLLVTGDDGTLRVLRTLDNVFVDQIAVSGGPMSVCGPCDESYIASSNRSGTSVTLVGRRLQRLDVSADTILAPRGPVDSGTVVIPRAVVSNRADSTAVFPVTLRIGAGYSSTVAETLPGLTTDTIAFPLWVASPVGALPVTCFTALPGDSDPDNDTARATVTVIRPASIDVSTDSIVAPQGTLLAGTVVTPRAVVRNRGQLARGFQVTMVIGLGYGLSVRDSLAPGAVDTVSFPDWTALASGTYPVTCFTSLAGDLNPANDTVRGQVIVNPIPGHDVGVQTILVPDTLVPAGDSLRPRAVIRNYGNQTERYFDVVFRIGSSYSRIVTCGVIEPDSSVELEFPAWLAPAGDHVAACSTMLAADTNRANDKAVKGFKAIRSLTLAIERDRVAGVRAGETNDFLYYAEVTGDTGAVVDLAPVDVPADWGVWFYDSAGNRAISTLGRVRPGRREHFQVRVRAPAVLSGDTAGLGDELFVVRGFCPADTAIKDSALLALTLTPKDFAIHNFPNPLRTRTTFQFDLAYDARVNLTVYNRAGERVRRVLVDDDRAAGFHFVSWPADNDHGQLVAPGVYEYVLAYSYQDRSGHITGKLLVTRD